MKAPKGTGANDHDNPPPGMHLARCAKVIDLGTQVAKWAGAEKSKRKILIFWELNKLMEDGLPFVHVERYTFSMYKNATLRKHIESWRGEKLTDEQADDMEIQKILGRACMLNLIEKDNGYMEVTSITRLMPGMVMPPLKAPQVYFSLDPAEFSQGVFEGLSEGLKVKIITSPEYQKIAQPKPARQANADGAPSPEEMANWKGDDDIPF